MDEGSCKERWPPSYDAQGLANTIQSLAKEGKLFTSFYKETAESSFFQGDIVELCAPMPYLSEPLEDIEEEAGFFRNLSNTLSSLFKPDRDYGVNTYSSIGIDPVATDYDYDYWMLISNSCDMSRPSSKDPYFLISPIEIVEKSVLTEGFKSSLELYTTAKQFFLPKWDQSDSDDFLYFVDFRKITLIHFEALRKQAVKLAELDRNQWYLLNCCIVRFLARDDGRCDPG